MEDLLAFVSVAVGMIAATRLDRIMNPEKKPQDPDAGPPAIEEHQP